MSLRKEDHERFWRDTRKQIGKNANSQGLIEGR